MLAAVAVASVMTVAPFEIVLDVGHWPSGLRETRLDIEWESSEEICKGKFVLVAKSVRGAVVGMDSITQSTKWSVTETGDTWLAISPPAGQHAVTVRFTNAGWKPVVGWRLKLVEEVMERR